MADFDSFVLTGMNPFSPEPQDDNGDFVNLFSTSTEASFLYKMRAVDDGLSPPGFIYWIATLEDFSATQAPVTVGSIVPGSPIVISSWRAV